MSHFAAIAPPFYSHMRALQALAQTLIARGHRVTFIQQADAAALLNNTAIGFHAVGLETHPVGTLDRTLQLAAHPGGLGILRLIGDMASSTDMLCRELPDAIERLGIDALLADQMEAAGG
ncbi:MAG TPA: zeaxanthin glucosyltransferase, partial [Pantoea sp.]|nr:zeaxanthin glucosyltransferase [Pantoea sp.]